MYCTNIGNDISQNKKFENILFISTIYSKSIVYHEVIFAKRVKLALNVKIWGSFLRLTIWLCKKS